MNGGPGGSSSGSGGPGARTCTVSALGFSKYIGHSVLFTLKMRVVVDLSSFGREKLLFGVKEEIKSVADFLVSVTTRAGLTLSTALEARWGDAVILPSEPISVLRDGDTIAVRQSTGGTSTLLSSQSRFEESGKVSAYGRPPVKKCRTRGKRGGKKHKKGPGRVSNTKGADLSLNAQSARVNHSAGQASKAAKRKHATDQADTMRDTKRACLDRKLPSPAQLGGSALELIHSHFETLPSGAVPAVGSVIRYSTLELDEAAMVPVVSPPQYGRVVASSPSPAAGNDPNVIIARMNVIAGRDGRAYGGVPIAGDQHNLDWSSVIDVACMSRNDSAAASLSTDANLTNSAAYDAEREWLPTSPPPEEFSSFLLAQGVATAAATVSASAASGPAPLATSAVAPAPPSLVGDVAPPVLNQARDERQAREDRRKHNSRVKMGVGAIFKMMTAPAVAPPPVKPGSHSPAS